MKGHMILLSLLLLRASLCLGLEIQTDQFAAGINLPSTRGQGDDINFEPGVFFYNYSDDFIRDVNPRSGFNAFRLGVNVETARDPSLLDQLRSVIERMHPRGNGTIVAMFDTRRANETGRGDGRVNNVTEMAEAWTAIAQVMVGLEGIFYEIFNPPFGYDEDGEDYLKEMLEIIRLAELPSDRVILNGVGKTSKVRVLADLGWEGYLGYRVDPLMLNLVDPDRNQTGFSERIIADLRSITQRTFITEFWADLSLGCVDATDVSNSNGSVGVSSQRLGGLGDALRRFYTGGAGVRGAYFWHGRGDEFTGGRFSFWPRSNAFGAARIQRILLRAGEATKPLGAPETELLPLACAPTASPTGAPTTTSVPSASPSATPTAVPSATPTAAPSQTSDTITVQDVEPNADGEGFNTDGADDGGEVNDESEKAALRRKLRDIIGGASLGCAFLMCASLAYNHLARRSIRKDAPSTVELGGSRVLGHLSCASCADAERITIQIESKKPSMSSSVVVGDRKINDNEEPCSDCEKAGADENCSFRAGTNGDLKPEAKAASV